MARQRDANEARQMLKLTSVVKDDNGIHFLV